MSSGRDEMMSKWEDEARFEKIQNVAVELDEYLFNVAEKYELSASQINGIFMARILRMNIELKNEDNFYKLLEVILQKDHDQWEKDRSIH
jgi:hypothetical protein